MEQHIRVSKQGYEELEKRYDWLVQVKRVEVANKLKEARSYGDLSENAEYDEAKNEQAIVEAEILSVKEMLDNAVVISDSDLSESEVRVGAYVELFDFEENENFEIQIVGSTESDPENDKISEDSPVGGGCMGKKIGDKFEVETPDGLRNFEVKAIRISK
ncbi:MAG: transcription elongation factor GreA [Ruminococcus sp.]|jgi:transcription elongation factor GreA|nr:transcription elongation factor GreA [Ruminococcus sp.]